MKSNAKRDAFVIKFSLFKHILASAIVLIAQTDYTTHQIHEGKLLLFEHSQFVGCNGFKGGAIFSTTANVTGHHSYFQENSAYNGGALYASGLLCGALDGITFTGNTACFANTCTFDYRQGELPTSSLIRSNVSYGEAKTGSLQYWGGFPVLSLCTICSCRSNNSLPAVRTSSGRKPIPGSLLQDVVFLNNTAKKDGVVFQSFRYKTFARLDGCTLIGNSCDDSYIQFFNCNAKVKITISNCFVSAKKEEAFSENPENIFVVDDRTVFAEEN